MWHDSCNHSLISFTGHDHYCSILNILHPFHCYCPKGKKTKTYISWGRHANDDDHLVIDLMPVVPEESSQTFMKILKLNNTYLSRQIKSNGTRKFLHEPQQASVELLSDSAFKIYNIMWITIYCFTNSLISWPFANFCSRLPTKQK